MEPEEQVARVREIRPDALAERLASGRPPRILDVRERYEWDIAHIEGAELMPLSEIADWWRPLDRGEELVVHCHHGMRSLAVCRALAAEGFQRMVNLSGGIEAWRLEVDRDMPGY